MRARVLLYIYYIKIVMSNFALLVGRVQNFGVDANSKKDGGIIEIMKINFIKHYGIILLCLDFSAKRLKRMK